MESRFWNKFEYVTPGALAAIWKAREELNVTTIIFANNSYQILSRGEFRRFPFRSSARIITLPQSRQ